MTTFYNQTRINTVSPQDRNLRRIEQDVLRMGSLVEQSSRLTHQCLFQRNLEAPKKIIYLDKSIDRYYRQIERDCCELMCSQPFFGQDARQLSAFMQLVRDLERIGDYAKDLCELGIKLCSYSPHPCLKKIESMSYQSQLMLAKSLEALIELDAQVGVSVKQLDDKVDDLYLEVYNSLAREQYTPGAVEPILLLTLIIRHLERMADHATNIGQRVGYIVTGSRG